MPRTKRPAKRPEKTVEQDEFTKKFNKILQEEKKNIELKAKMTCREIELAFEILIDSFTPETLQRTVGDLKNELFLQDPINVRSNEEVRLRSRTDDGYMTQNSSQSSGGSSTSRMRAPPSVAKTSRRSRSADASSRKPSARVAAATHRRRSRSVYKTPMYKNVPSYPPITPKVAPDTALTVLRQPRQGEMVLSLTGSPVMVPTCFTQMKKANCNILLRDGTMLSLQPKHLRESQDYIPFALMDQKVLHQLKTLKDNLDTVVKLGEKHFRRENERASPQGVHPRSPLPMVNRTSRGGTSVLLGNPSQLHHFLMYKDTIHRQYSLRAMSQVYADEFHRSRKPSWLCRLLMYDLREYY
ncbi:Borealin [Eumeta japonica]|uniref:Borealin n=1 Tax=Eumeta variegata TaxID=151549 RepID=A0A4C1Y508_EUMVA|nr:Borealin [Eumeta japonica]